MRPSPIPVPAGRFDALLCDPTSTLFEAYWGYKTILKHKKCILTHSPDICSSLGALGRIIDEEEMVEGLLVSQHGSARVHFTGGDQKSAWACSYRSSTPHSWHRPACSAWLLSMAPLTQMSVVTQEPSAHPSRKECVRSSPQHNAYTKPKPMFISEQRLSARVFVNRLRLCHHMTFRSSCFYLANPRGALTAPTEVMDDFVCTERGLSTKCVVYCSIKKKARRLWYRLALKKAEQDLWHVFSLPLPCLCFHTSSIHTVCNDLRDAIGCNVSAFSVLP